MHGTIPPTAAPPFIYDRMNNIQLVSSGNSDPHRHMYRLHSALKRLRSSCRPVNRVGVAIFGSLVVVGSGGSVDARICRLRNPMQAPPICESSLQSKAYHKCIVGVGE